MAVETERRELVIEPRRPALSWGAVFAGLFLIIGLSWLFFLLGSAIGTTVADVSDSEAVGEGFGIGAALWLLFTALATYFLGGLLAARLSGVADRQVGMLHGVTLWGLATVVALVLGYWGVRGALETGQTILSGSAAAAGTVISGAGSLAEASADTAQQLADSEIGDQVQAALAQGLAQAASETSGPGRGAVTPAEARSAAEEIDAATVRRAAQAMARGEDEAARDALAEGTSLSEAQIDSLVRGTRERIGTQLERASESELVQSATRELNEELDSVLGAVSRSAGPAVTRGELRQAIDSLDPQTVADAARYIVAGDEGRAETLLAARTPLSEREVRAVVSGVRRETAAQIDAFREDLRQAAEDASTYAQAALWAVFVSGALALIACLAGGIVGAGAVQRVPVHVHRHVSA